MSASDTPAPEEATSPETANLRVRAKGLAMALDRAGETACAAEVRAITSDLFRMVEAPVTLPAPEEQGARFPETAEELPPMTCSSDYYDHNLAPPASEAGHREDSDEARFDALRRAWQIRGSLVNMEMIELCELTDRAFARLRQLRAERTGPGTPSYRLTWLLDQLSQRFAVEKPFSSEGSEPKYLAAIDALAAENAQLRAEGERLAGLLALTEKSLHLAETSLELEKRRGQRAREEAAREQLTEVGHQWQALNDEEFDHWLYVTKGVERA